MRAARTRAGLEVWLDWLAAVLDQDDNGLSQCSLSRTDGNLLLTGCCVVAHTAHNEFLVRDERSLVYFFTWKGAVSAHL